MFVADVDDHAAVAAPNLACAVVTRCALRPYREPPCHQLALEVETEACC